MSARCVLCKGVIMSGNTFGHLFCLTTFGESHGPAIGGIIDGCPPGLSLSVDDIQPDLDRRRPGTSRYTSQRREADKVQILSGVFSGKTTGAPIGLLIENQDARSQDYDDLEHCFRPGHADFTYFKKYGVRDHRGGGRASARETAIRVAAGAIAKKYLQECAGITIRACVTQIGEIAVNEIQWDIVNQNSFFAPQLQIIPLWEELITSMRRAGDSIGAKIMVVAEPMPVGLGEPVFDKLDARIALAMMGINAVKGVEIGAGFEAIRQKGSEHRDEMTPQGFLSNHAGGILGGISSGQPLVVSLAVKPPASITLPGQSITTMGEPCTIITKGRHDPCVGIRAVPVAEAMLALVLMDFWLMR